LAVAVKNLCELQSEIPKTMTSLLKHLENIFPELEVLDNLLFLFYNTYENIWRYELWQI